MDNLTPVIEHLKGKKYEDGITLITCTGDRFQCMKACADYIYRQTYHPNGKLPVEWIICDDGNNKIQFETPNKPNFIHWPDDDAYGELDPKVNLIYRQPIKNPVKSFIGNLREALLNIKYNKILIIEDDDWYSPNYIELYSQRLDQFQLIGEAPARYYHVGKRVYKIWGNDSRASLCQTAFRASVIPTIYICTYKQDSPFVDYRLWQKTCHTKFLWQDECHCIGIKGMPGRGGIGAGHRARHGYKSDKDLSQLTKWIGREDAEFYRQFYLQKD